MSYADPVALGVKTVVAAGTKIQISTVKIPVKSIFIQASKANTGLTHVGIYADMVVATGVGILFTLSPGEGRAISREQNSMLNLDVYGLDAATSGNFAYVSYQE